MPASKFKAATAGRHAKTSTSAGASKAAPRPQAPQKNIASQPIVLPPHTQPSVDYAAGEVLPAALISHAVRYWWVLFLCIVVGGLLGLLFSTFRPAEYEAIARFHGSIDYVSTGPLTQYEEDSAYNVIGNILISDEVMQTVVDAANAEGMSLDPLELHQMVSAEKKFDTWELRIRSGSKAQSQRVAEIWTEKGQAVLMESYQHAVMARQLSRAVESLENCLETAASVDTVGAVCSQSRFVDIQNDLREAGVQLYEEAVASRGFFAGLTVSLTEPVTVSDGPVLYGRNGLILAGCLIGLLVGVLAVEMNLPARLFPRILKRS